MDLTVVCRALCRDCTVHGARARVSVWCLGRRGVAVGLARRDTYAVAVRRVARVGGGARVWRSGQTQVNHNAQQTDERDTRHKRHIR